MSRILNQHNLSKIVALRVSFAELEAASLLGISVSVSLPSNNPTDDPKKLIYLTEAMDLAKAESLLSDLRNKVKELQRMKPRLGEQSQIENFAIIYKADSDLGWSIKPAHHWAAYSVVKELAKSQGYESLLNGYTKDGARRLADLITVRANERIAKFNSRRITAGTAV